MEGAGELLSGVRPLKIKTHRRTESKRTRERLRLSAGSPASLVSGLSEDTSQLVRHCKASFSICHPESHMSRK